MKTKAIESILHDWVLTLPFQQQALLMTGMRGPDGMPKHNNAKSIVRYLRGAVIKAAGDWNGTNNNDFMWGEYGPNDRVQNVFAMWVRIFWDSHDEFPHHFIMHLLHCGQVVGYKHSDTRIRRSWRHFYMVGCEAFHMLPEPPAEMDIRLNDFGHAVYEQSMQTI